jgi:1,2-diacylglycerol 3-beta-galactosyltransferase
MTDILIAYSDTGGGHRAAAIAVRDELSWLRADTHTTLLDPFAQCPRWPFRSLSTSYPRVIAHAPWLWQAGFRVTNTRRRTQVLQQLAWPAMRHTFVDIAHTYAPDVIVSTHPLLTAPLRRVYPRTPIVVIVTDLISGHASWYNAGADLTSVPSLAARDVAIRTGLPKDAVCVRRTGRTHLCVGAWRAPGAPRETRLVGGATRHSARWWRRWCRSARIAVRRN